MTRLADLSAFRAELRLDEEECRAWFGVGPATLERIESGEVEPAPDVAERIDRFIEICGGGFHSFPPAAPHPPSTHSGGSRRGGGGGLTSASVPAVSSGQPI